MIIEIYKGNAYHKENEKLIEIAAMSKIKADLPIRQENSETMGNTKFEY